MSVTKLGDIVWGRVKGHPMWPGQVMDPESASAKANKHRKPNTVLISFFGDSSFGWFGKEVLLPFEPNFSKLSKQKTTHKSFQKAVEEAVEVLDRRAGRTPKTNHSPVDFLNPSPDDDDEEPEEEATANDAIVVEPPVGAQQEDFEACSSEQVLKWLHNTAVDSFCTHLPKDLSSAAERIVFSLRTSQAVVNAQTTAELCKEGGPTTNTTGHTADHLPGTLKDGIPSGSSKEGAEGKRAKKKRKHDEEKAATAQKVKHHKHGGECSAVRKGVAKRAANPAPTINKGGAKQEQVLDKVQGSGRKTGVAFVRKNLWSIDLKGCIMLRMGCDKILSQLKAVAHDPMQFLEQQPITTAMSLALLRYREKVYGRSTLNRAVALGEDATVGDSLRDAMQHATATAPTKEGNHVPAGNDADEISTAATTAIYKEYQDQIGSWEDFMSSICDFYKDRGLELKAPVYEKRELELYDFFKEVASRGGYEAVTATRKWRAVALALRPDIGHNPNSAIIRKLYVRLLLDYEGKVAQGAASHEIQLLKKSSSPAQAPPAKRPRKIMASKCAGGGEDIAAGSKVAGMGNVEDVGDEEGLQAAASSPESGDSSDSDYNADMDKAARSKFIAHRPLARRSAGNSKKQKMRRKVVEDGLSLSAGGGGNTRRESGGEGTTTTTKEMEKSSGRQGRDVAQSKNHREKVPSSRIQSRDAKRKGQLQMLLAKFDKMYGSESEDEDESQEDDGGENRAGSLQRKGSDANSLRRLSGAQSVPRRSTGPPKDTVLIRFDRGCPLPSRAVINVYARKFGEPREVRILSPNYMVIVHYHNESDAVEAYDEFRRKADVWFSQKKGSLSVDLDITRRRKAPPPHRSGQDRGGPDSIGVQRPASAKIPYLHRSASSDHPNQPPPHPPQTTSQPPGATTRGDGPRVFDGLPEDPRRRRMAVGAAQPPPTPSDQNPQPGGLPQMHIPAAEARQQFYGQQLGPPLHGPPPPAVVHAAPPPPAPMQMGGQWNQAQPTMTPPPHMPGPGPYPQHMQHNMVPLHMSMQQPGPATVPQGMPMQVHANGVPHQPTAPIAVLPQQQPAAPVNVPDFSAILQNPGELMAILQNAGVRPDLAGNAPPSSYQPSTIAAGGQPLQGSGPTGQLPVPASQSQDIGAQLLDLMDLLKGGAQS